MSIRYMATLHLQNQTKSISDMNANANNQNLHKGLQPYPCKEIVKQMVLEEFLLEHCFLLKSYLKANSIFFQFHMIVFLENCVLEKLVVVLALIIYEDTFPQSFESGPLLHVSELIRMACIFSLSSAFHLQCKANTSICKVLYIEITYSVRFIPFKYTMLHHRNTPYSLTELFYALVHFLWHTTLHTHSNTLV